MTSASRNLSCYSDGMMGYRTPNIDRIATEGMRFTDSYGEQSCTAGRAAFISGQSVYRTGMSKVGIPGVDIGWAAEDPTIPELLKPLGYATGQFGKNHFGDMNKFLPTVHGFDEFYGNLYHLNAEEEPEQFDYPHKDQFPRLYELALPRGVLDCKATDEVSTEPDDPKFGPVGKQTIVDTGPLTAKRMETIDDDIADRTVEYIKRQHDTGTPFFVWCNFTHMHLYTHLKPGSKGQAGMWQSEYHDAMIDHDKNVGSVLDVLDELGIADDTIVIYSTDNGPHRNSWPDAGTTPFRSEKNTNWEGAYRVPEMIRWPGKIKAGTVSNEIIQHHDWLPTLVAAAGDPDIVEKLKKGHRIGDTEYKVHIDGFNLLPYLMGEVENSPRRGFFYFSDDAELVGDALRELEDRVHGAALPGHAADLGRAVHGAAGAEDVQPAHRSVRVRRHHVEHLLRLVPAARLLRRSTRRRWRRQFLDTFKEFPPRHQPASFSDRPDRGEARRVPRRLTRCWSPGHDGPTKSAIVEFVGARGRCGRRPKNASPCSTTTARCGVRSRPTSSSTSWCAGSPNRWRPIPALAAKQPYTAAAAGDLAWFGDAVTKHYNGDDSDLKLLAGAVLSANATITTEEHAARVERVLRRSQASDAGPGVHRLRVCADGRVVALPGGHSASPTTSSPAVAATSCGPSPRRCTAFHRSG